MNLYKTEKVKKIWWVAKRLPIYNNPYLLLLCCVVDFFGWDIVNRSFGILYAVKFLLWDIINHIAIFDGFGVCHNKILSARLADGATFMIYREMLV